MQDISIVISGVGHYLPEKVLSNFDIGKFVDTDDEWIYKRTGIKNRHIASDSEFTSTMAINAAIHAIVDAKVSVDMVDALVLATTTPDRIFPATAVQVQRSIGMRNGSFAFDIQAVCSGFVYAMYVARSMLISNDINTVLVVCSETMSRIVDWKDRSTCVLFGDGAGAVLMQKKSGFRASNISDHNIHGNDINNHDIHDNDTHFLSQFPRNPIYSDDDLGFRNNIGSVIESGIIDICLKSDGSALDILKIDGGVSMGNLDKKIEMSGKELFKYAVNTIANIISEMIEKNGFAISDIDWFLLHQANHRILEAVSDLLSFPKSKIVSTIENRANTGSASIPIALSEYRKSGQILKGQKVVIAAIGGGITTGCAIVVM